MKGFSVQVFEPGGACNNIFNSFCIRGENNKQKAVKVQAVIFIAENLLLPILANVVAYIICKWIDRKFK